MDGFSDGLASVESWYKHVQSFKPEAFAAAKAKYVSTRLFDAYNHCDLATFSSLIVEDMEFYHDKSGLALGRPALVEGIKNNICGKVTRELVPGTMEVYPIANYGAVKIGIHRFHHPGQEDSDSIGEAKFIHLWQNKDGGWKVTRVISLDRQSVKN